MAMVIAHVKKDSAAWAIVVEDRSEAVIAFEDYLNLPSVGGRLKQPQFDDLAALEAGTVDSLELWGYTFSIIEVATPLEVTSYGTL